MGAATMDPSSGIRAVGVAYQLAVTAQPQSAGANSSLGTITVQVQDPFGNVAPGVFQVAMIPVIWSSQNLPGIVSGTLTQTTVNGTATFTGLTVNIADNGYTLQAQCPGLAPATSTMFNVTGSGGTRHVIPSTGVPTTDGAAYVAALAAASSGDVVYLSSAATYDVGGGVATGQIVQPNGVSVVGTGPGTIVQSEYERVGVGQHVGWNVGSNCAVANLFYRSNQTIISQGIGAGSADSLTANGAVFYNFNMNGQDPDGFYFHNSGSAPALQIINCFLNLPWDTYVDTTADTTPVFYNTSIRSFGNFISGGERLAHGPAPSGATIAYYCSFAANATAIGSGSAATAFTLNSPGSATLYDGSLSSSNVNSSPAPLDINSGAQSVNVYGTAWNSAKGGGTAITNNQLLVITQQPTTTAHGSAITPAPTVAFQDGSGNTQSVTGSVQAFLWSLSQNGIVPFKSGTLTQTAVAGVCTFNDLVVGTPGQYQLIFAALGMPNVKSNPFTIT